MPANPSNTSFLMEDSHVIGNNSMSQSNELYVFFFNFVSAK